MKKYVAKRQFGQLSAKLKKLFIPRRIVGVLLTCTVVASVMLVLRDTGFINFERLFGELRLGIGSDRPPISLATVSTYLNDNYSRCQNKMGMELPFTLDNNKLIQGDELKSMQDTMQDMYLSGMKYVLVRILLYGKYDVDNLKLVVRNAYDHHLIAIIVPERSPSGAGTDVKKNADALYDLYDKVSNLDGNATFIASTASRELLNSGNYTEAVAAASDVARRLHPGGNLHSNVITATPAMLIDTEAGMEQATWMKDYGLLLKDFDIMLLMIQNNDVTYRDDSSEYFKTAYYNFESVGDPAGTRFAPKQWLRDENDANQYFQRAIIMNFGTKTPPTGNDKLVQRLGFDFGKFSDDPVVDGVVFLPNAFSYDDFKKVNLYGTNCNYDQVDYQTKFTANSAAPVCETRADSANPPASTTSAKIICDTTQNVCETQINYTIQVGLPVRHLGSTSAAGTDTNPFMPACARAASTVALPYYDFLNQFAGKLQSSDGKTYMLPWLGNGLNCALAAKIKFFYPQSLFEYRAGFSLGAAVNQAAGELASELALNGGIYPGPSLWSYVSGKDVKVKWTDERVLYSGKSIGLDKTYIQDIDSLAYYDPARTANTFEQSMACGGQVQRVKTDPQNMIYGSEQIVDSDGWKGTPAELCYAYWAPKSGIATVEKAGRGLNCALNFQPGCRCDLSSGNPAFTAGNIQRGTCQASAAMVNKCIKYLSGAEDYLNSGAVLVSNRFNAVLTQSIPKYDIPGAYDALAATYKLVQDKFAERNLKLVFNEKWGWKSDVVLRAYANMPGVSNTAGRKNQLLENSSKPVPLNLPYSSTESVNTGITQKGAQCQVGVNFAIPYSSLSADQISEAVNVGYGYGQVIVFDAGNAGDVTNKLNQMCGAGITPVIRSCTVGNCGFSGGSDQGAYLKQVIDGSSCKEVYAVCGHNEPVPENPNGMVDEGHWTKSCVDAIGSDDKVKITTPIFNATFGTATETVVEHAAQFVQGYGNFAADKSKFACLAFNTYDHVGSNDPNDVAEMYYRRITDIPDFSDMPTCIMETGDLSSNSDSAMQSLLNRLLGQSKLIFVLGFNWTGTNPDSAWTKFVIPDKGKAVVGQVCSGAGGATTSFSIPGQYMTAYTQYEADGQNFYEAHQYYEMLGYIDELNRIYDVLPQSNQLPTGELQLSGKNVFLNADKAEYFAGLTGCNSEAYKNLIAKTGEKVNCIGTINDTDPLGDFLCKKGYNVSDQCQLACPVPTENNPSIIFTGKYDQVTCPLQQQHSCFQGPYGDYTHCDEGDLPMDFFPAFSGGVTEAFFDEIKNLPIDQQFEIGNSRFGPRDERVYAPEDGTVLTAGRYQYGGQILIKGKAGIVYTLNHIDPDKFLVKQGDQVTKGQQLGTLWHGYGYRNMHLHVSATLDGGNVDPYLIYGDILGCNAVRPAVGAKYRSEAGAGMCQYGDGKLNDNACINDKNRPVDGAKVISKYETVYGAPKTSTVINSTSSSPAVAGLTTSSQTKQPAPLVLASDISVADTIQTTNGAAAGNNCSGATCPVLTAKNGVSYPACTNADYSLCDDPDRMNVAFGDGSPVDRTGMCSDQAKRVGAAIHPQLISFLGQGFTVNPKVINVLKQVEADINAQAKSHDGNTYVFPSGTYTFDAAGAFNARPIRGYEETSGAACKISNHSWGTALDLNAGANTFQANTCNYDMPPEVVWAFEKNGFRWGGRYGDGAHFDPMHFEYCQASGSNAPPPGQGVPISCPVIPLTDPTNPPGNVTREDVLKLCSPALTTFVEIDPATVIAAYKQVSNIDVDRSRVQQIIDMARAQNINPAFLFGFWFTEGGYRGDNVAGQKAGTTPVGYDFGCGLSASCKIAERFPAGTIAGAELKALTDDRFNKSLQCAAKSSAVACKLACSYTNIASNAPLTIPGYGTQQAGLGGFLECYGPVSDGNAYFASNFIKIYDAIFPPGTLGGRVSDASCSMNL